MKSSIVVTFILLCGLLPWHDLQAEPVTETPVATDSVDLFAHTQEPQKSAALAMAASLILPGSGHEYLGRDQSALAYISVDVAAIFGFFFCMNYSQKLTEDAEGYAWLHSGAQAPVSNTAYWNAVGSFWNTQAYNTTMNLNRTPNLEITSPSQVWQWDDQSSQDRFNSLLSSSHKFQVVGDFMLGAMVINRALAFIDVRAYTRNLRIKPQVSISPQSIDLSLSASF